MTKLANDTCNLQFLTTVVGFLQVPTQMGATSTEVSIRPCYTNELVLTNEKHSCNKCNIKSGTINKYNI